MPDPLDDFYTEPKILEKDGSSQSSRNGSPGGILNLLSWILAAGTIGIGLLFSVIFVHPQSRLNPLPPTTLPELLVLQEPSSTPRPVLPPTWTPTIAPTETPVLTPFPTDKDASNNESTPISAVELEDRNPDAQQDLSTYPEDLESLNSSLGGNLPEGSGQIYAVKDLPVKAQLAPLLNQPQLASALSEPIPAEQFLIESSSSEDGVSDLFTPEIQYWEEEILDWAEEYDLDPNLIAAVMQVESCGYNRAKSAAGAMGLFQVMPHHFKNREDPYDPDTNAYRGLRWLQQTLKSGGSTAMALASYNAGIARAKNPNLDWPAETRRYVFWGLNIYQDAAGGYDTSYALDNWLSKGGAALCSRAATEQQAP